LAEVWPQFSAFDERFLKIVAPPQQLAEGASREIVGTALAKSRCVPYLDVVGRHRQIGANDLDCEGMDARLQFVIQGLHDSTMLLQPGRIVELGRGDADAEMGLASLAPSRVSPVFSALVEDFKMGGGEFEGKFLNNRVANGHMDTGSDVY
jgi:hypothetical protein